MSMAENLRRGCLTCVTRLPKEQQQPLEAVSVSPSCHEESWHFECPRRSLVPSNVSPQPVGSNPCTTCSQLHRGASLHHPAQLHQAYSAHPSSPSSAHPAHQAPVQAHPGHGGQWPGATSSLDAHAAWHLPQPQRTTFQAAARAPLSLAQLAQRRARPLSDSEWSRPCKRQCTPVSPAHVAQQRDILQPLSTHTPFPAAACMQRSPSLQHGASPSSHLNPTATGPCHLQGSTIQDFDVSQQRAGVVTGPDVLRMCQHSTAQRPSLGVAVGAHMRPQVATQDIPQLRILRDHSRLRQEGNASATAQHAQHIQQQWGNLHALQGVCHKFACPCLPALPM